MDLFRNTRQPDREWWNELWPTPERTLEALGLDAGMSVADVGCGDGRFTIPAARLVAPAPVYGIDLDDDLLEAVTTTAAAEGLTNVEAVHGDARRLADLLPDPVDFALVGNTFHGVEAQVDLAEQAHRSLTPNGRFAVINWHDLPREETTVGGTERGPPEELRMRPADTRDVLAAASFTDIEEIDLPPYHYAIVGHRE
jgi:SAM-dependent methyltransferase